jgi:hypothetical protein
MSRSVERANDNFCKALFFYQYEMRYEKIIKKLRAIRIEQCAKMLENLRLS